MTYIYKRDPNSAALIDSRARLGSNVRLQLGAVASGRCEIHDDVDVGPGCVLDAGEGLLVIESGCTMGAAATVAPPTTTIGHGARILPGTVVTRDVPPHAIVSGNPAQIIGYTTSATDIRPSKGGEPPTSPGSQTTAVTGVTIHRLTKVLDLRGNLTVGEFERSVPFLAKRYFMVFGVPNSEIRGEHAHRTCHQFLVCAHGSCSVMADDGQTRLEILLDDPSVGLHLPPLTWGVQYKYSADAVLLVFASEFYNPDEYIRDYAEFTRLAHAAHRERAS